MDNSTHHMSSSIWGCLGLDSPQLLVVEADDLYRKYLNIGKTPKAPNFTTLVPAGRTEEQVATNTASVVVFSR